MKELIKYHLDCLIITIPVFLILSFILFKIFGADIPEPDLQVYAGTRAYITDFLDSPSFETIYEGRYSDFETQWQAELMTKAAIKKSLLISIPIAIITHLITFKKAYGK